MPPEFHTAAVIGAGTMGAQIAALFANAGLQVVLLDVTAEAARDGLKRARALKPDPFFTASAPSAIVTGGLDADFDKMARADWIVEAIVEQIEPKRALFERIDRMRSGRTVVSTNTSGIPIASLSDGRSDAFARHFLGTHFFNPPRYLHLLELIASPKTDPAVMQRVAHFADVHLGKGVVIAKDTPDFIANHLGIYGVLLVLNALESGQYTIEEIDAITGPPIGRPKSATFRTLDLAGIDVFAHVARHLGLKIPHVVDELVARGWIGEKAGQGFYKRERQRGERGDASVILTLDPSTMTYRPRQAPKLASLDAVRSVSDTAERIRTLFAGADKVGAFLRDTLPPLIAHATEVAPAIAYSIDDIDRAMRWGFGWELGPFEIADALAAPGAARFREGRVPPTDGGLEILKSAKDRDKTLRRNAGASLVDIGDGVLALELHGRMNVIGGDTVEMIHAGIREAADNFAALVIGTDAADFSFGANLMLVLLEAQEGNWDEIDAMVRAFQNATTALRASPTPVVVATAGRTLGGGCEMAMHADRVQAAAESYIGLVEVGVGLIPAGGGTKELLARGLAHAPGAAPDLLAVAQQAFETIGFAKVSTSAGQAAELGYLREVDRITMNRDRLIADAKACALERVRDGYQPTRPATIRVGGEGVLAALKLGVHLAWRAGRISDHDAVVGRALANVLAGGSLPNATMVTEAYLLDLEREAFLKLCGERKTLERMQYTLKNGKPLRN